MVRNSKGEGRSEALIALDSRLLEMVSDLAEIVKSFKDEKFSELAPEARRREIEPRITDLLFGLSQVADTIGIPFESLQDQVTAKKKRRKIS